MEVKHSDYLRYCVRLYNERHYPERIHTVEEIFIKIANIQESTNIDSLEYDQARAVLRVTFKGARTYDYYGVPASLVFDMLRADSAGRYFNANLRNRDNLFPYREVTEQAKAAVG